MIPRLAGAAALVGTSILAISALRAEDLSALRAEAPVDAQGKGRPKAELRVNPAVIFPPARIVVTLELKDGANDFQEYYCPKIEWIWGDGTESESSEDCDPYEAGKSEIRRRYTSDHNYRSDPMGGNTSFEVIVRMKQGSKIVLSQRQSIRVQGH
jgi:hypothetical protein